MDLEALLTPYDDPTADAFVAFLFLEAGGDTPLSPVHARRLDRFAANAGLAAGQPEEERRRLVDRYFQQHPLPAPLLEFFHRAVLEVGTEATDQTRLASRALGTEPSSTAPSPRPKGAPAGGQLNILLAREYPSQRGTRARRTGG